jgi:peptidyl-prolyl cis-trans isomerase C
LVREPLFHFILIAALLFAAYQWLNPAAPPFEAQQIVLTKDDLLQIKLPRLAQGLPEPAPAEMREMIAAKVREEVLYREALAMGLDQQDTIIKRRLAQKMDFLAEDISDLREPGDEELKDWLRDHPEDFSYPPRISFHHFFYAFDAHGSAAGDVAAEAYSQVTGQPADFIPAVHDAFMFENSYVERAPREIAGIFGPKFAEAVFALPPGSWSAPVESGFGWHLVYVDALTPERLPELEEVYADVKSQWMANQREEFKEAAYEVMRAKYEVILPDPAADETLPGAGEGN